MKTLILCFSFLILSISSIAAPIQITLSATDQRSLTDELSRIDYQYRREEIDQSGPIPLRHTYYEFLNGQYAFGISCYEKFYLGAYPVGQDAKCWVVFNPALSSESSVVVRPGFAPEVIIAEIKDQKLAYILYKTIGNGSSPVVSFQTTELVPVVNPSTGQKGNSFRLRISCDRNHDYTSINCMIAAVK